MPKNVGIGQAQGLSGVGQRLVKGLKGTADRAVHQREYHYHGGKDGGFINAVEIKNLLGVLAHGHVAVANGQLYITVFQQIGQLVKAVGALGITLCHGQGHLVLQQVNAAAGHQQILALGVLLGIILQRTIQSVHLLGSGGNEQVTYGPLLDLGQQLAGGIKVEADPYVFVFSHVLVTDGGEGLREGGCGKHRQLYGFIILFAVFAAAGHQAQSHDQRQEQGNKLFHRGFSFLTFVYISAQFFCEDNGGRGSCA